MPQTLDMERLIEAYFPGFVAIWLHLAVFVVFSSVELIPTLAVKPSTTLAVEILSAADYPLFKGRNRQMSEAYQARGSEAPETGIDLNPEMETSDEVLERQVARLPDPSRNAAEESLPETKSWVTAHELRAAAVLANPRSEQAQKALLTVTGDDRQVQLCALEAMEQVRIEEDGFRPTRMVPYALESVSVKNGIMLAPRGALRSRFVWYEIAFRCKLDAAGTTITGFEYALGDRIPRDQWDALGLAPVH